MSVLRKENGRMEYMKTVGICMPIGNSKFYTDEDDRFYSGEFNYSKVENRIKSEVLDEETQACANVLKFFERDAVAKTSFEDIEDSFYDWSEGVAKISPKVDKFRGVAPELELESMIILMYLRTCGYKEIYEREIYENVYNFVLDNQMSNTKTYVLNGIVKTESIVCEEWFNKIIKSEFRFEELAWGYVEDVLTMANYCVDSDGYKCYFTKESVEKIKEYYLHKKVRELHKVRLEGEIVIANNHIFKRK